MFLCSWHILQLGVLFFDNVYNQPQKLLCPFFECALVYTTTGMGCWFRCIFKWTIYYFINTIKGNCSTVSYQIVQNIIQNWPCNFLRFWCGVLRLKIVEDWIFLCILKSGTRTRKFVCVQSLTGTGMSTRFFNFNCVNQFLNGVFTQICCLSVSLSQLQ